MRVWRVCAASHVAASGEGARRYGGRWNPRGLPVVYTATHESLAILELLVQANWSRIGGDFRVLGIDVPDDSVATLDMGSLPADWRTVPAPPELADIGGAWLRGATSVAMRVPSAVVQREFNVLLNPLHPAFSAVKVVLDEPLRLDPRLA